MIWILLVVGLVGGFGVGVLVGRRAERADLLFTDDELEVDSRLFLARQAVGERVQKRLDRIMSKAEAEGRITNDGVEDLFCISDRTASTYLRTLTEQGRLKRQGAGRSTFYTPQ